MSMYGTNFAAAPNALNPVDQAQKGQDFGFQMGQKLAAIHALQGVNLADPSSVDQGITGLLGAGATDQANALLGLQLNRTINQGTVPLVKNALGAAEAKQQQPPAEAAPTPDPVAAQHQAIMQKGADAVTDLLNTPLGARAAKAQAYSAQFAQMGVPQENIAEITGDLSDDGLKAHQAFLQEQAQGGNTIAHPTGYGASQALMASDPTYGQASSTLTGPYSDPFVQAILKSKGLDVAPGIEQAIAETNPARTQAANAAFAPTVAASTTAATNAANLATAPAVDAARATATTTATNLANLNTLPAVQGAVAKAVAQNTAAGSPMEITLPDGSSQKGVLNYDEGGKPYFVPIGSAPVAGGGSAGPPITSPSITGATEQKGGSEANVAQANAFEQYTGGYVNRKANLENLRTAAAQIPTGPNAPFWASLGALKQEYAPGTTLNIGPNATATANFEEVKKVAAAVLAQQRESMGLPNTNQSVTLSTGATPGEETSPLGIQRLAGLLEGNEDYGNAARQAWETWKSAGNGRATYQEFLNGWNKVFDPRVFQAQYFDPAEQAVVKKEIPNYAAQVAAAKRLGYINAP